MTEPREVTVRDAELRTFGMSLSNFVDIDELREAIQRATAAIRALED